MKKMIVLAFLAVLTATAGSAAEQKSYQLLDINGDPLCEVFNLTQHKSGIVEGVLAGSCGQKDRVGGLYGGVWKVSGGPAWTIVLRETLFSDTAQFVVVLNEKDLTWTAFTQDDGTRPYSFLTQGTLEDLNVPPARGARSLASMLGDARQQQASAKPAQGVEVHYTFAQQDGTPYCDGLALTQSTKLAVGTHTASSSCGGGEYAGGNYGYMKAVGGKVWTIYTTSNETPGADYVFVLDENAMTWSMYSQQSGNYDFQLLGNGILLPGDPQSPARKSVLSAAPPR